MSGKREKLNRVVENLIDAVDKQWRITLPAETCPLILVRLEEAINVEGGALALKVFDTKEGRKASCIVQKIVDAAREKTPIPYSWDIVDEQIVMYGGQQQIFPLIAGFAAGLRVAGMSKPCAINLLRTFVQGFAEDTPAES